MTFQANIPLSTDLISVSQSDIKNNFQALLTSWNVNHVDFNAAGAGKHKFVSLPNQAVDPATAVTELALYSKAISGLSQLFMRQQSNGTVTQLTGDITNGNPGSIFLPGGVIIKWGSTGVINDNSTVVFSSDFPTSCYGVLLTIIDPNATSKTVNVKTGSVTGHQFLVRASAALSAFYIAIGH